MKEILDLKKEYESLDYLSSLNNEQKIAATVRDGNFLVLAGPGSGKTHTLIYRVKHLIKTGIDPKEIVIITFTRKAARELENRIFKEFNVKNLLGFVGTFHSFAFYLLRTNKALKNISGFKLIDPEDEQLILKKLREENNIEFKNKFRMSTLVKINSYSINTLEDIRSAFEKTGNNKYISDYDNIDKLLKIYKRYKSEKNMVTYDDLLVFVEKFLKDHIHEINNRFNYLMIDEYQDTNNLQIQFIKAIGIENIMAIGDDFQSIYGFRGANHEIILNFGNDFSDAQLIKLRYNYRSTKEIVTAINLLIKDSKIGYHKDLVSGVKNKGSVNFYNGIMANDVINNTINSAVSNHDFSYAFIYRANSDRIAIEKELVRRGIDYVVYGGIRMLERKHIKDILAMAFVKLNNHDELSYTRILTLLPGVGEKTALKLFHANLDLNISLSSDASELIGMYKELIYTKQYNSSSDFIVDAIRTYLKYPDLIESEYYTLDEIKEDLDVIFELSKEYNDLFTFVTEVILENSVDKKKGDRHQVVLTTIHSAKGLEFDVVTFLFSIFRFSEYSVEQLEEDRRLAYVAMSRAKSELNIIDQGINARNYNEFVNYFNRGGYSSSLNFNSRTINNNSKQHSTYKNKEVKTISAKWVLMVLVTLTFGFVGVHRFINKDFKNGLLMLITFGGCGIWWFFDLFIVLFGQFKDSDGNKIGWYQ